TGAKKKTPPASLGGCPDCKRIEIDNAAFSQLQQEVEKIQGLPPGKVMSILALEKHKYGLALIMEDFEGVPIGYLQEELKKDILLFLDVAIKIAESLKALHRARIIHRNITPNNILYNPENHELKLDCFEVTAILTGEPVDMNHPDVVDDILPYISPEQTGRMNRPIDYRSDFYSLGITFFQLLTGRVPFNIKEPLELIHSHIAKEQLPPHEINRNIPGPVSAMVMKLLAKEAADRYQDADGLIYDLALCRRELQNHGAIENFTAGSKDVSLKLEASCRLVDREKETEILNNAFARAAAGETSFVPITGRAGAGKTFLVQDFYCTRFRDGYFGFGSFHRYDTHIPYSALARAFRQLILQMLTESDAQLQYWKETFLEAIGRDCGLIIGLIPDLEAIVGPQPTPETIRPQERKQRLYNAFHRFVEAFAREGKPLVLLQDNLHRADQVSLDLLADLLKSDLSKHLLVIATYCDTDENPMPAAMTEEIKKAGCNTTPIVLRPLGRAGISLLLADILNCGPQEIRGPAGILLEKTKGNPLYFNLFLKSLVEKNILVFHFDKGWQWNTVELETLQAPEDVVSLLSQKIEAFPRGTFEVLKTAACIGRSFELKTLTAVYEKPIEKTCIDLSSAAAESFMLFMEGKYRFAHGKIEEAAYNMVPDALKKELHLKIGLYVYDLSCEPDSGEDLMENIFYIACKMNRGMDAVRKKELRVKVAELNLAAGKKAQTYAAFQAAGHYFETGLKMARSLKSCWKNHYYLMLQLTVNMAECQYLNGHIVDAEKRFVRALGKAVTYIDKANILARWGTVGNFEPKSDGREADLDGHVSDQDSHDPKSNPDGHEPTSEGYEPKFEGYEPKIEGDEPNEI
ncbi:MAG: AAA family ATPase, partial [bacterium]|nr:AAA family ATPase [bacterium]